ncbi:ATP-binding cassette domain-containing protein [Kurthia sibirica]|uniref:ABC transporter domain-containing protein n=1 Tax=Kurthia sibirica TaxID=202750 RepID=A0A2U3AKQ1_9BACL|nr:ATP-binding cassette domain-containing protein [Kurthia sibirica]PWI25100.1 hypothetical protein DEX24_10170 [Kurthia sibirica]GEK34020.1 hypothetical protein KSI01_15530 [Kurthia sibirica]
MTKINLNNVQVTPYKNKVTLVVEKGEFLAISGEHKKVLLEIIVGLREIESGTYHLDYHRNETKDLDDLSAMRQEKIGYVPYEMYLLPSMTFIQNIEMPYYFQSSASRMDATKHQRLEQQCRLFGVQSLLANKASTLTYAQQRYMVILRALLNSPAILVLDEPFKGLNDEEITSIIRFLRLLKNDGVTIIIGLSDEHLMTQCDRHYTIDFIEKNAEAN